MSVKSYQMIQSIETYISIKGYVNLLHMYDTDIQFSNSQVTQEV